MLGKCSFQIEDQRHALWIFFCPICMENISKITCHLDADLYMTRAGAIRGVLNGVMAFYGGSNIGAYYVFGYCK